MRVLSSLRATWTSLLRSYAIQPRGAHTGATLGETEYRGILHQTLGELLVVQVHQVQHRGVDIIDVGLVFDCRHTVLAGGVVALAALDVTGLAAGQRPTPKGPPSDCAAPAC